MGAKKMRSDKPIKLLVLTSTFPTKENDNLPPFVAHLCSRLSPFFEVHVLCPHAFGLPVKEFMHGCIVHRFRYAPEKMELLAYNGGILSNIKIHPQLLAVVPLFILSQLLHALRISRKYDVFLIHAHWVFPQGFIALILKLLNRKIRFVVTGHGGDIFGLKSRFFSLIKKCIMNSSDHVTMVSEVMKEYCVKLGVDNKKISVVSMGVDLERSFKPDSIIAPPENCIFVGRLVEKKGVIFLIQAWKKVIKKFADSTLHILGDGPERKKLVAFTELNGLEGNIIFHGAVDNRRVSEFYRQAKVAIMPSIVGSDGDQEGLGLVAVESIGCGCLFVASDLPAIRDVVKDGVNGRLVPPCDTESLSKVIIEYLSGEYILPLDKYQRHSHLKKRFDWGVIANKYKNILLRVSIK